MADAAADGGNGRPTKRQRKSTNGKQAPSEDEGDAAGLEASNSIRDMGGVAARAEIDDAGGDGGWRRGLEELRKQPRRQPRSEQRAEPLSKDRLLALVREAVEHGKWEPVTAPAMWPRSADIAAVVRQLDAQEVFELLKACASRYESHPRERNVCASWIMQALDEDHVRRTPVRKQLRPLLAALTRALGPPGRSSEVLGCLGKWRYVAELAAVRRETMKDAGAGAPQPATAKKEPPQGGDDDREDSDEEDDDDGEAELPCQSDDE